MRELYIAGRRIADDTAPFVIAEIGHNHGGSVEQAEALILAARRADCDAVKCQKRDNRILYTAEMYNQPYNSEHSYGRTYGEHREALELGRKEYTYLKAFAEDLGLIFFATAFDIPSADLLAQLGVPVIKIASGDLTNWPLQEYIAALGIPMILSTGGATAVMVLETVRNLRGLGASFALLQCTATYPAKAEQLNLRVIESYRQSYPETIIGLSDHEDGIALAPVAYALGARIFEKHLTLNRASKGSDQAFSIEPHSMWQMVHTLRATTLALGDGIKRCYPEEEPALRKMGKSLYARQYMSPEHMIERDDIAIKSPGGGIPPSKLGTIIGSWATREVEPDTMLVRGRNLPLLIERGANV